LYTESSILSGPQYYFESSGVVELSSSNKGVIMDFTMKSDSPQAYQMGSVAVSLNSGKVHLFSFCQHFLLNDYDDLEYITKWSMISTK